MLLPVSGLAQGVLLSERVVSAQAHQATIETVRQITDEAGQSVLATNRYVELATGLNRKDPRSGEWVRARDTTEVFAQGFVARQSAHQVIWPKVLDATAVVDMLDAEGHRYQSRALGLSWFDAASGKSVLIAETRSSTGRLIAPNTVLYPDAFTGGKADLAYVNRRDGLAQEVILREALPGPEFWGLDPETTRLEVMTEFVEAPAATVKARVLRRLAEGTARARWQSPDLVDGEVSFGAYRFGRGRAFDTGQRHELGTGTEVAKRWEEVAGRRVLFEQVEWRRVRDQINRLPLPCPPTGALVSGNPAATSNGPIETYDFDTGTRVNSFVPDGAKVAPANGRGLAIRGSEIFYTHIAGSSDSPGPTDAIHVAPYGTEGSGGADIRTLPNPRPDVGIQELAFHDGDLYALTGYKLGPLQVFRLNPATGEVIAGPISISSPATFSADGFTVLPNGNFLISDSDGSDGAATYREYDGATGQLVSGGLVIDPSALGFQNNSGIATSPDGASLYFLGDFHILVQTDLTGMVLAAHDLDSPQWNLEDIAVVVP